MEVEVALYEDHLLVHDCISRKESNIWKSLNQNYAFPRNFKSCPYLSKWRLWVALYWYGISMRAASAKAASFFDVSVFSDMILVKLTNCRRKTCKKVCFCSPIETTQPISSTWKLVLWRFARHPINILYFQFHEYPPNIPQLSEYVFQSELRIQSEGLLGDVFQCSHFESSECITLGFRYYWDTIRTLLP